MSHMKTCFFVYFRYIFAIFMQFSFVPYLTSACPAALLFKTENWLAQSPMSLSTTPPPATASSSKICSTPPHKKCRDWPPDSPWGVLFRTVGDAGPYKIHRTTRQGRLPAARKKDGFPRLAKQGSQSAAQNEQKQQIRLTLLPVYYRIKFRNNYSI